MAFITADFVRETTTTTGTGNITLAGARAPARTFASVAATSDTFHYAISQTSPNEWEVGTGVLLTSTTFSRSVLASSNANALVNFSAGTKSVDLVVPADRFRVATDTDLIDVDESSPGVVRWLHKDFPEGSFLGQVLDGGTQQPRHVAWEDFAGTGVDYNVLLSNASAVFPSVVFEASQQFASAATSYVVTMPTVFNAVTNPTGRKPGDRIQIAINVSTATGVLGMITLTGWTLISEAFATAATAAVFELIIDSAGSNDPGASVTINNTSTAAGAVSHLWLVRDSHTALASRLSRAKTVVTNTTVGSGTLIPQDGIANYLLIGAVALDDEATVSTFPTGFANGQGQVSNASATTTIDCALGFAWKQERITQITPSNWIFGSTPGAIGMVWAVPPIPAGTINTAEAAVPTASSLVGNLFDFAFASRSWSITDLMGVALVPSSSMANGPFPSRSGTQLTLFFAESATTQVVPFPVASNDQGVLMTVATSANRTITTPTDWTLVRSESTGNSRVSVYWRYVDGTETKPISLVLSATDVIIVQFDVFDDAHPTQVPEASGTALGAGGTTVDCPSLSPSTGIANYYWLLKTGFDNENATSISFPLPDGQGTLENAGAVNDLEFVYCEQQSRATSLDPAAQTWTGANRAATILVAIPPRSVTVINVDDVPVDALASQGPGTVLMNDTVTTVPPTAVSVATAEFAFTKRVVLTAGTPGTADDVTVFNANAPFGFRITDVKLIVLTTIAAQTVQLRDTAGGAGAALSSTFSTTVAGEAAITASWTATSTVAVSGSLFVRRSDRGAAGEVIITYVRT